jgi:hypothetical protein
MSHVLGMIAAAPEWTAASFYRLSRPLVGVLRFLARDKGRFDDGYDKVADAAARWGGLI